MVWGEDKMRWCLGSKEDFDIKSFYGLLRGSSSITFSLEEYLGCEGSTSCLFLFGQLHGGRFSQQII